MPLQPRTPLGGELQVLSRRQVVVKPRGVGQESDVSTHLVGFGNDIGGSLRNPATCCGIASIKPTHGVVPTATLIPPQDGGLSAQIMLTDGPMARHVADVRAALEVIAGFHQRDPRSVPLQLVDHTEGRPLKVAVMAEPPAGSTHPEVAASVRRAADAMAQALAQVTIKPPAAPLVGAVTTRPPAAFSSFTAMAKACSHSLASSPRDSSAASRSRRRRVAS